jgi:hypothetical protein
MVDPSTVSYLRPFLREMYALPYMGWEIYPSLYLITVFPAAYVNISGIDIRYEYCTHPQSQFTTEPRATKDALS